MKVCSCSEFENVNIEVRLSDISNLEREGLN